MGDDTYKVLTMSFNQSTMCHMATSTYNFKRFDKDFTPGAAEISITKHYAITFSAKFCKVTDILKFNYVIFFFDETRQAIGILPTNKQEIASFKLTREKFNATVSATSFLKANKIDPKIYSGRYEWKQEHVAGIGELYIIELKK